MTAHLRQVEFLTTGHTHNDVDGVFGILSQLLRREDAWTPHEMQEIFKRCVVKSAEQQHRMAGMQEEGRTASAAGIARVVEVKAVPNFQKVYSWQVSYNPIQAAEIQGRCCSLRRRRAG